MKIVFSAFALAFAVPALAQTAPSADPHVGHAQHQHQNQNQQQTAAGATRHDMMDHARMMEMCKDPKASAEMKAHCAEMMKQHGQGQPAPAQSQEPHAQHSH